MEIEKTMNKSGGNVRVSRVLIKFELAEISRSIVRGQIANDGKYYLNMYDATHTIFHIVNHYGLILLVVVEF